MKYPIVQIKTPDNLILHGLLLEAEGSDTIIINIHGTASNFYENDFIEQEAATLVDNEISLLSTNNRGSEVLKAYPPMGNALEIFEDAIIDIDSWVEFVISRGYRRIILQGHSLGTEKVIYYMNKGKNAQSINAIILLAFSDSYGTHENHLKALGIDSSQLTLEALEAIKKGNEKKILRHDCIVKSEAILKTAKSYVNFFQSDSELSKALPLRQGRGLTLFQKINVPILAVIGDKDDEEYTIIPIKQAINLLEKENAKTTAYQIKSTNHDFDDKEMELAKMVLQFIKKHIG